jgi:hypothetical protein
MTTKELKRTGANVMVSGRMDPQLLARAKAVAYWTPGLTFSALMEEGAGTFLESWEKEHGRPDPAPGLLRTGAPLRWRQFR